MTSALGKFTASERGATQFTRSDGQLVPCQVSVSSPGYLNVKSQIKPARGEFILIEQMVGKIVFRDASGFTIKIIDARTDARASQSDATVSEVVRSCTQ